MRNALVIAVVLGGCACGAGRVETSANAPLSNAAPVRTHGHELLATLERTACFGECPIYKLAVYRDGVVEYNGERFVKRAGKLTAQLSTREVEALEQLFNDHRYLDLRDTYTKYNVTDMPSVNTSYVYAPGQTKAIKHYLGDGSAPSELTEVEDAFDRIVHSERWIGTEDERAAKP
jgi:hypothetical protein